MTSRSSHWPETPFDVNSPLVAKPILEPTTRSRTVRETKIWLRWDDARLRTGRSQSSIDVLPPGTKTTGRSPSPIRW